jgi:uncharacterized protein YbjT (DUF2867 family)
MGADSSLAMRMRILLLGGNGFIGSAAAAALARAGHDVTALGRDIAAASRRLPSVRFMAADLRRMTDPARWTVLLAGIDAVVNCAGALQENGRDDPAAVQDAAMRALYAAAATGRPRIVQVSANTGGGGAGLAFLASKRAADAALAASGLRHVILRPALVIGRNAHGGTSLLRGLAAFPLVTPLAYPSSDVAVIALDDTVRAIVAAVEGRLGDAADLDLAHARSASLAELVAAHRAWLGLPPARTLAMPAWIAGLAGICGDVAGWFGWRSPLRTTAMAIMAAGVTPRLESSREAAESMLQELSGKPLLSLEETLALHPAGAQDLWFARLWLAKPLLWLALSAFWIASGAIALASMDGAAGHLAAAGVPPRFAPPMAACAALADIALGLAVLWRRHAAAALHAMIAVAAAYLAGATLLRPDLWLDPLGPLVKIVPALLLAATARMILEER